MREYDDPPEKYRTLDEKWDDMKYDYNSRRRDLYEEQRKPIYKGEPIGKCRVEIRQEIND